jgi:hypothetical protein
MKVNLRTTAFLILGAMLLAVPSAKATTVDFNFTTCAQTLATCATDYGNPSLTYTVAGFSVVATGYNTATDPPSGVGTAANVEAKASPDPAEVGLGMGVEPPLNDKEIGAKQFIQLDVNNLNSNGITNGTLILASLQTGPNDQLQVCFSNISGTACAGGTIVAGQSPSNAISAPVPVNWSGFRYIDIKHYSGVDGNLQFLTVTVPVATSCPLTQGFWKNHAGTKKQANVWPVPHTGTALTIGGINYTQAQLLQVYNTAPKGDAVLILADQLITAELNYANGAPKTVTSVISDADGDLTSINLLSHVAVDASSVLGQDMVGDGSTLDTYNNNENCTDDTN